MKVGAEPWRLLIQAEEHPAGQRAVADHGVNVGETCHSPVPGNLPGEAQRPEGNIRRLIADQGFDQGLAARVSEIDIDAVAGRGEWIRNVARDLNRRAGSLGAHVDRDGVEIAVDPTLHRQRAEPGDDRRRREPGAAGERGGIRCAEPEGERCDRRAGGLLDGTCQRRLGSAGSESEIDRQHVLIARERAIQRYLAECLGANVGIDVEEREDTVERVSRAFDREIETWRCPDRAPDA